MLTAAIETPYVIIRKFLYLIYALSPKVCRIFYDFSACLLEFFKSNIIMISPLNNFLAAIILPFSRCLLIEEIKE